MRCNHNNNVWIDMGLHHWMVLYCGDCALRHNLPRTWCSAPRALFRLK